MTPRQLALAALLASTSLHPAAAADGAIRSVTLSSGGLAEVVRSAPASSGKVEIEVPLEQVDDVLKSLVVIGGTGSVRQLSLGGLSPVEEVMRRMPFSAEDLGSLPTLLQRLQGVRVVAEGGGRTVEGTVLGVGTARGENGAETAVLSLMEDGGTAAAVPLTAEVSVRILDAAVLAKIADAASAIGRAKADGARTIEIVVDGAPGEASASVDLAYVVAAPIWKTAYRIVAAEDGTTARMQAWAVVENATGEDWDGVALTLASGAPVTMKQRLFERYWRQRPDVPVDVDGAPLPRADGGEMAMAPKLAARAAPAPAPAMAMTDSYAEAEAASDGAGYDDAAATVSASASESDVSASFVVAGAIDLGAGETLSVPIVDASVKAERVSLFQPGVAGVHPVAALLLSNDTGASLPPGILTIYGAEDGYLGDAQLLGMPAGDSRMVSFAIDRKVTVDREAMPERAIVEIKAADGLLSAEVRSRDRTVYTVTGAKDGPRDVVIEHPRQEGWEFSSAAPTSRTESAYRLKAHVDAGGTATVEAVEERLEAETLTLTDADPDALLSFASESEDAGAKTKLQSLAAARRLVLESETAIGELDEARDRIEKKQDRIRKNLQAVPQASALAKGYLDDMASEETEFGRIEDRRRALETERKERRQAFEAIIRDL